MQGRCLSCGAKQNLTEQLCKGQGCWVCGASLKASLAKLIAEGVALTFLMTDNFGANALAVATLRPLSDLVSGPTEGGSM